MLTSVRSLLAASALAGAVFVATPALADDAAAAPSFVTVTGSASIVSQYRFRGISQSDNRPAVQGSITLSTAPGFYISTWGSSATAGNSTVDIGGTEIDVYGGFTHALGKSGVTVDMGLYGYLYPGMPTLNYYELYGSLSKSFGPIGTKVGVNVAPSQANVGRTDTYVYVELTGAIPTTPITLHAHLGHTGGAFDYTKDYFDYTVGASYTWKHLTFDLSWVDTNVSKSDAVANPLYPNAFETYRAAKGVVVASLTASF